ncbi:MAG: hypothetical protein JSS20_10335 [Proteobacteria bacterium]|nr:hypothetical protein [Pseudomonadota bacterium]
MASHVVDFVLGLVDKWSGPAGAVARAAEMAERQMRALGAASNVVDAALAHAGASARASAERMTATMAAQQRQAERTAVAVRQVGEQHAAVGRQYEEFAKKHGRQPSGAAEVIAARQMAGRSGSGSGGGGAGLGQKAIEAWFLADIARGALHAVDSAIQAPADIATMREKLKWSTGGDAAAADAAVAKARKWSGKYMNTTVMENLHIIDDLRANLPESMDKITSDVAEPFVRLHSFFKAWNGGAHAGVAEKSLQDITAGIRSGELTGAMSGKLLQQFTEDLAAARVVFGDKFKVREYLSATQKAATALSAADPTFRDVDFPVMIQRLGVNAGVALATSFQKFVGGIRMPSYSIEAWRRLGLADEGLLQREHLVNPTTGMVRPGAIAGRKWLEGSDEYANNLTNAIMTRLVPALATKGGITGLQGVAEAWKRGDIDGAVHLFESFRQNSTQMAALARELTALGYTANASKALEELILGSASIMRDRGRMRMVQRDFQSYGSYDKSKQEAAAATNRLWTTVTSGAPDVGQTVAHWYATAVNSFTDTLLKMPRVLDLNNPEAMKKWADQHFAERASHPGGTASAGSGWLNGLLDSIGAAAQRLRDAVITPAHGAELAPAGGALRLGMFAESASRLAQQEVAVRMEPLQVSIQQGTPLSGTVNVQISGRLEAPQGSGHGDVNGSINAASNAPRGESSPVKK